MDNNEFTTTFMQDFRIADAFGIEAIKDTFNRAFNEWKDSYQYCADLCCVMNHLCWLHYENGNQELSRLYSEYYYKVRDYGLDNFKGQELNYFFHMID